jgi:spore photoproduct lyase
MYTNLDQLEQQIDERYSRQFLRMSPGNLTDSLGLDHILNYSSEVMRIAERFPKILIEFKTKSDFVDNVLTNPPYLKNVVMSWSINTERVTREDEKLTATLTERLAAAKRCVQAGAFLAFHFDPLAIYPG